MNLELTCSTSFPPSTRVYGDQMDGTRCVLLDAHFMGTWKSLSVAKVRKAELVFTL